jgi:hypothetical protein
MRTDRWAVFMVSPPVDDLGFRVRHVTGLTNECERRDCTMLARAGESRVPFLMRFALVRPATAMGFLKATDASVAAGVRANSTQALKDGVITPALFNKLNNGKVTWQEAEEAAAAVSSFLENTPAAARPG